MNDNTKEYFACFQRCLLALFVAACFTAIVTYCVPCVAYDVAIVVDTEQNERVTAANELASYLHRIYPSKRFEVVGNRSKVISPNVIYLAMKHSLQPGTYVVQGSSENELQINGADIQGLRAGIEVLSSLTMSLSPILDDTPPKLPLPPGQYRLAIHSDNQPYLLEACWRDSKSKKHDFVSGDMRFNCLSQNHAKSIHDIVLTEWGSIWIKIKPTDLPVRIYAITLTCIPHGQ